VAQLGLNHLAFEGEAMEFFHFMVWPFLACIVLTGIHAYLGLHVIEREVIFVDLALAQIAALGSALALLFGQAHDGSIAYWISLGFTLLGAAVFSLTRLRAQKIPQEAVIGMTYAVAAAMLVMVLSRSSEGDEHIREALVGNVLLIEPKEVIKIFCIYSLVGLFHFVFRKKFLLISQNPEEAFRQGISVKLWDFLFYASFGLVVTSSVKVAGVLLVFSLLVIPASSAVLFAGSIRGRLFLGWGVGVIGSIVGMILSYFGDFPTGASVVCALAGVLIICSALSPR
jgi:zinc/manganese transport system permease protein